MLIPANLLYGFLAGLQEISPEGAKKGALQNIFIIAAQPESINSTKAYPKETGKVPHISLSICRYKLVKKQFLNVKASPTKLTDWSNFAS